MPRPIPCNSSNCCPGRPNTRCIRDAKIEELNWSNRTGFVTVSYGVPVDNNLIVIELLVLTVGPNTIIQDQRGQSLTFRDLRIGMMLDADFSQRMTASIPPQAQAFRLIIRNQRPNFDVSQGRIIEINNRNNFIDIINPNNRIPAMRFNINNRTIILDRRGREISLRDLRVGQNIRVEHATFTTPSIPPQTTAFLIQII